MAAMNEWLPMVIRFGTGVSTSPWAVIELFDASALPGQYHWTAKHPDSFERTGWSDTLEDAQRQCEDVMFPDSLPSETSESYTSPLTQENTHGTY